jgi:hypothetical protein
MSEPNGLRRALSRVKRGPGKRYPIALRQRATAWCVSQRSAGATWTSIAEGLGVHMATVRAWCPQGERARMRRVQVVDEGRTVSVVSPLGYRVEGVTLLEATALLAKLG